MRDGSPPSLDETFAAHGVRFAYPSEWELSEQNRDGELSITVSSPHTSFWTLSLFFDRPEPADIIEAVLDAFRDEYSELDVYPSQVKLCHRQTVARDIEFVCLELLNSAWARAFQTEEFTALVLYQAYDAELIETGDVLERITRSLECDGDEGAGEQADDEEE
jgi:hypothetical protein